MAGPSDLEQLLLEYVNDTRMDPAGSAARYISAYDALRSSDMAIQNALDYFQVSGSALKAAFAGLTPVAPVAWNDNLATAARTHNQVMIDTQSQTHQAPGEPGLMQRVVNAGYANARGVGENVFAYSQSMLYAHAGFMVDWGNGPNGMQDPAGHRVNIMNASWTEVGIGVTAETSSANPLGPYVVTQDFGVRSGAGRFVTGVAYTDRDANRFYSVGEGRGDLTIVLNGGTTTSYASGGWQAAAGGAGQVATLTGGGLAGAVAVTLNAGSGNVKLDVVNGDTLKAYGDVTVAGPVATIELLGAGGGKVALAGAFSTRVLGTAGNDTIAGAAGHDRLFGGSGADVISGGGGNDHLFGQSATGGADGADSLSGGDGADYLQGNAGNDTLDGGAGSDRINGGADADLIRGGDGNDSANGNLGADTLLGEAGNDSLRGGQGDDVLDGGAGDDTLRGDVGADRLTGGAGLDVLFGGDGADRFVFGAGDGRFVGAGMDAIGDFQGGTDRIDLPFAVSSVVQGAAQASAELAALTAATLLNATAGTSEVVALQVGGDTLLFYGGVEGGLPVEAIRLSAVTAATVGVDDFI